MSFKAILLEFVLIALGIYATFKTVSAIRLGYVKGEGYRKGTFSKKDHPITYWINVMGGTLVIIFCAAGLIIVLRQAR